MGRGQAGPPSVRSSAADTELDTRKDSDCLKCHPPPKKLGRQAGGLGGARWPHPTDPQGYSATPILAPQPHRPSPPPSRPRATLASAPARSRAPHLSPGSQPGHPEGRRRSPHEMRLLLEKPRGAARGTKVCSYFIYKYTFNDEINTDIWKPS